MVGSMKTIKGKMGLVRNMIFTRKRNLSENNCSNKNVRRNVKLSETMNSLRKACSTVYNCMAKR